MCSGYFYSNCCKLDQDVGTKQFFYTNAGIFEFFYNCTANGSQLVFDYAVKGGSNQESMDSDKHYQALVKAGERPGFVLEGEIQEFLKAYSLEIIDELDSEKLAKRYFNTENFEPAAQKFRLVRAVKKG